MSEWWQEAEELCESIVNVPVYCVNGDELPADCQAQGCGGFCGANVDLDVYPFIKDRWRGRGAAMVLFPSRFWQSACREDILMHRMNHIAGHEISHWLDAAACRMRLLRNIPPDTAAEWQADYAARKPLDEASCRESILSYSTYSEPWGGHDADWIRACIHVAARSELTLGNMEVAGVSYSLLPSNVYRDALGSEPQDRLGDPIVEVLADYPPPAFTALFEADVLRWYREQAKEPQNVG